MDKKKEISKLTVLNEGKIRRGGVKPEPTCPKPKIKPSGQKPSSSKKSQ
jgi:hypothetical protein